MDIFGVGSQITHCDIIQPIRRIHLTRARVQTNAGTRNEIPINSVLRRLKPRISPAKAFAVLEMDTGLILDIDLCVQILEKLPGTDNTVALGLPGQIRVEVKIVVVLHA